MRNSIAVMPDCSVISRHTVAEVWLNNHTQQHSLHAIIPLKPGYVIADFSAAETLPYPTLYTVQLGHQKHITLYPQFLQYVNHSCDPNVFFDTTAMQLVSLKEILPGEELRFFYPSTEWEMDQPFVCNCGSQNCLQYINGASRLSDETLSSYRLSHYVKKMLQHRL